MPDFDESDHPRDSDGKFTSGEEATKEPAPISKWALQKSGDVSPRERLKARREKAYDEYISKRESLTKGLKAIEGEEARKLESSGTIPSWRDGNWQNIATARGPSGTPMGVLSRIPGWGYAERASGGFQLTLWHDPKMAKK